MKERIYIYFFYKIDDKKYMLCNTLGYFYITSHCTDILFALNQYFGSKCILLRGAKIFAHLCKTVNKKWL